MQKIRGNCKNAYPLVTCTRVCSLEVGCQIDGLHAENETFEVDSEGWIYVEEERGKEIHMARER